MSKTQVAGASQIWQTVKKAVVSAIVIGTFAAYVNHDHFANTDDSADSLDFSQDSTPTAEPTVTPTPNPVQSPLSVAGFPSVTPTWPYYPEPSDATQTEAPTPTALPLNAPPGGYKDGTYTGPVTNAYFGNVQVQAIVSSGKITQVNFLQYPRDRRTSEIINQRAMPRLQNEVIQSQNVHVNVVTGATLTSNAFEQSLQTALSSAEN